MRPNDIVKHFYKQDLPIIFNVSPTYVMGSCFNRCDAQFINVSAFKTRNNLFIYQR